MKLTTKKWTIALGAGLIASIGMLPQARSELVYEPAANAPAQAQADDREQTRQALDASQRAQNTLQAQSQPAPTAYTPQQQYAPAPPAPPTAPMIQQMQAPATVSAQEAPQPEVQSLSKTELMRRERTREELKNEDILQERLEELRLRDEKKRTNQLLGDGQSADAQAAPIAALAIPAPAQPQSQVVVSPVTDRPGQPAPEVATIPAPQAAGAGNSPYTLAAQNQMNSSQTTGASVIPEEKPASQFYISPHAGISSMSTSGPFNVNGHFAVGVAAGANVSDNLAVEVGYTYSEYGIQYGNTAAYSGYSFDTYTLKQNVIDAVLKFYLLGQDSKFRPFIGGGGGYSMASLDYPTNVYQYAGANQGYSTDSFLGELTAGADVKISKNISVGATFKYYNVLSSTQNNNLNYGAYQGSAFGSSVASPLQAQTGASLAQSGFYTMLAGVTFSF